MKQTQSYSVVVIACLGLGSVMGVQGTSHAAALDERAAPAIMKTGGQEEDSKGLTLRLALFDSVGLADGVLAAMKGRVEELMDELETSVEWVEPSSTSNDGDAEEEYYLKVMLFPYEPGRMGHVANAMGVVIGTQVPADAIWLFDPVIRRALESGSHRRPLSAVQTGRAYGRVAAHEIVHALANDQRHAESGLMAPSQNRNVLVSSSTDVDPGSVSAFHLGMVNLRMALVSSASAR